MVLCSLTRRTISFRWKADGVGQCGKGLGVGQEPIIRATTTADGSDRGGWSQGWEPFATGAFLLENGFLVGVFAGTCRLDDHNFLGLGGAGRSANLQVRQSPGFVQVLQVFSV